ncbi:OmpA family protein [Desulfovibrio sp. OttesenSCG-928-C14]|nr:OmpA family protein [Desulfovibrio sp. OttesenSCG-928-C14]
MKKKLLSALLVALMTFGLAAMASAQVKLQSFDFLVDYSDSMGWKYLKTGEKRINIAQDLLAEINSKIPDAPYNSVLNISAPSMTVLPYGPYDRWAMQDAINALAGNYKSGRSIYTVGEALHDHAAMFADMSRNGAVIAVTDGAYGRGRDSLNEAKIFYQTQPGMCLHFISLANTPEEQAIIDSMAQLNPCSVSVTAQSLMGNEAALEDFVQEVWGMPEPPAPAPVPVVEEREVVQSFVMNSHDVKFLFDSTEIDDKAESIIAEVVNLMKSDDDIKVQVDGYTCIIGSHQYNMDLSLRRAEAVRDELVRRGIDSSRISIRGNGPENPVADNNLWLGRKMNRRVEMTCYK